MPPLAGGRDLGAELIEVGPGPGASTDWLRHRVDRLVAVELDSGAAKRLSERFRDGDVEVLQADATALPFPESSFDSAASLTMLHHIPTAPLQNRLLTELLRVLRPGGILIGSDSRPSDDLHHFHEGDVYNPVEPALLFARLEALGFERVTVSTEGRMTFSAFKPAAVEVETPGRASQKQ